MPTTRCIWILSGKASRNCQPIGKWGGDVLVATGAAPLAILRDAQELGLPIHSDAPDDLDQENTHAPAVMTVAAEGGAVGRL